MNRLIASGQQMLSSEFSVGAYQSNVTTTLYAVQINLCEFL
jgi:hypothetical protein